MNANNLSDEERENIELHEMVLYPVVRVRTRVAGGSGTIIYSRQNEAGEWRTFALTNEHVIHESYRVNKRWDSLKRKHVFKEEKDIISVEQFDYNNYSEHVGQNATDAILYAYDEDEDLAIIELRDKERPASYIAKLYKGEDRDIRIFTPVVAVGSTLGHSPIATKGEIMCKSDIIQGRRFLMSNALTCFGNSGGALFIGRTKELIGVPSRITVSGGFFSQPITHMGYAIGIARILRFFDAQDCQFLYDPSFTIEQCEENRQKKLEKAQQKMDMILSD